VHITNLPVLGFYGDAAVNLRHSRWKNRQLHLWHDLLLPTLRHRRNYFPVHSDFIDPRKKSGEIRRSEVIALHADTSGPAIADWIPRVSSEIPSVMRLEEAHGYRSDAKAGSSRNGRREDHGCAESRARFITKGATILDWPATSRSARSAPETVTLLSRSQNGTQMRGTYT
jgi:hypothetical protein